MFVLNKEQFREFNLKEAKQFIDFWAEKYPETKTKVINNGDKTIIYLDELNLENRLNRLTEENIKRLLRWKDPRMLTEEKLSSPDKGKKNETVTNVLENLENINAFRFGKMSEQDFKEKTGNISGIGKHTVYRMFLFHIARPFEYPIADQNVYRAFSTQKQTDVPKDWKGYMHYMDYFFEVAISAGIITEKPKGDESNIDDLVRNLKRVDEALFAFGQFLYTYNRGE